MASQSLYRKWRSQTFDEMVGQEEITRTLKNALRTDNLSHAYLFTGPRGTGKTTTARLLAKTVNCTNSHNGEPCNECEQCREITAGTSFNVIEIDAASNRGIDSIRELREKVMVPPSTGKYKIYILDEAHMLTTEAFNALLKTLEEPPDYAIFVMATTDVHKMLPTVLSRCQRFDFKRFSTRQIVGHLLHVASEEKIEVERSAAELIARSAAGGMRDGLSLLDQAIAYAGNTISLAQIQAMLGVADPRAIWKLLTHIAELDSPALLYLIHELSEAGADLRQINTQVIDYWRALMLAKAGADVAAIMDLTEDEISEVKQLIPAFTLDELTEYARIFAQNDLMHKNQGTPQLGLELAALECSELHRRAQSGQSVKSVASASMPVSASPVSASPVERSIRQITPPPVEFPQPDASSTPRAPQPLQADPPVQPVRPAPSVEASHPNISPVHSALVLEEASRQEVSSAPAQGLILRQVMASWESVRQRIAQKSPMLATYIKMCTVLGVEVEDEYTVIVLRVAQERHFKFIREGNHPKDAEWALGLEFNRPCKLRVLSPDQPYAGAQTQQGSVSYSLGAVATAPSAHRERAASAPQADAPPPVYRERAESVSRTDAPPVYRERTASAPQADAPPPAYRERAESVSRTDAPPVYRERAAFAPQADAPPPAYRERAESVSRTDAPPRGSTLAEKSGGYQTSENPPLARQQSVRENKKVPLSKEELERKVREDPVVQQVIQTFGASIGNIYPK